jgi:hypothetical protein
MNELALPLWICAIMLADLAGGQVCGWFTLLIFVITKAASIIINRKETNGRTD